MRSRCFAIIEDADQFTDHDTARDWLCESTMADFSDFLGDTLIGSSLAPLQDRRPVRVDLDTALGLWEYASGEDIDQFDKEGILHMIDAAKKAEGVEPYVSQAGPNGGVDDGEDLRAGGPVSEGDPWRDGMSHRSPGLMEQVVDLDAKAAAGADTVLAELFEPLANNSTDAATNSSGSIRGLTQADARLSPRFSTP